ncbi:unnamed protein product [Rotaria sp. Silwood1]|nr:unnamed protein product [Rotaria sp. Silwood1]CAF3451731.1 unnamed protein product [Rotaria sp. Silwood1]CAF4532321.1 unnamed protein product [Rotaria sp. Silwood1]
MNRFGDIEASFNELPPVYGYHAEKLVSLEKALEPIESQIDELPRFINIAKRDAHFPSEHGLTHDQSAAVYIYTMEWSDTTLYRVLNKALRSKNRLALKIWFPYLKLFDTALNKLPTVKDVVWRGVPLDIGKHFIKNQIFTWWSINSCSSSVKIIESFIGNNKNATFFLIEAVKGKNISGYTEYKNEDEIILRMGSQFRVKSDVLKQSNGSLLVHLIELDNNDDQSLASTMNKMELASESSNTNTSVIPNIPANARWTRYGVTVAGGHGYGSATNQLWGPHGLFVDDDQTIVIADTYNHRIVQWRAGETNGQVVAGGHGKGNRLDQLNEPTDVMIDKETDSLIICDRENRRVVRWSRRSGTAHGEVLIHHVKCWGLAMDDQRYLYISDYEKDEVRRYEKGDRNGIVVAGGNGIGSGLNQLNGPTYLFVDKQQSVYVSDRSNDRVMKWEKGATEGIVVAGHQGQGSGLTQLSYPNGIFVNAWGTVCVADTWNNRVMGWSQAATQGTIIVGGHGAGAKANQFHGPMAIIASDLFLYCKKYPYDNSSLASQYPTKDLLTEMLDQFVHHVFNQEWKPNMVLVLVAGATRSKHTGKNLGAQLRRHVCHHARNIKSFQYAFIQTCNPATCHIYIKKMNEKETRIVDPATWIWKKKNNGLSCPFKDYNDEPVVNILVDLTEKNSIGED